MRTWCRLVCYTLVEVVVLDFRGMEVQRCGDEQRHKGGLQVRGWETLLIYELKYKGGVQRIYIYTKTIGLGIRCKYGGAYGKVRSACGWRRRMEKAYGGGMVAKGDMWDNIVTIKGCKYTIESELTKRR